MGILDNFENWLEVDEIAHQNLVSKIFSETVCKDCSESSPMIPTDNKGEQILWEQENLDL